MNSDSWYRNEVWNKGIEKHFNDKLSRVRLKQDFLRIQASYLKNKYPVAALALLDRYFEQGMHFDTAHAWYDRAVAYCVLGKTTFALDAYTQALKEEDHNPTRLTQAYLGLPLLVADAEIKTSYPLALDVLKRHAHRKTSLRDYFEWNAAYALILSDQGSEVEAMKYATEAIQAKQDHANGLKHHINVGSMPKGERHDNIYNKITVIATCGKPSLKDRLSRMFSN